VAADVVHRDERHIQRVGRALGKVQPHEHRADETRRVGRGHGVDVFFLDARLLERLIGQRGDGLDVLARRDLRHDAAVERVQVGLRRDGVGEDFAPVLDDRDGGFVAGGLESENFHCCASASAAPNSFVMMMASSFGWS
jgi:hypothetical protein